MSDYESMDRNPADPPVPQPMDYPPPPAPPVADHGSQYQGDPQQVVSRMPDLSRSDRDMQHERAKRRSRRREGLDPAVKLYLGTGTVIVLIVVALFLWKGVESDDATPGQEQASWEPPMPHPDAPMAPAWQSPDADAQTWQPQAAAPEYGQPDAYPTAGVWDGTEQPVGPDPWGEQPQAQPWPEQPDPSALGGQPQPGAWGAQAETPSWDTQQPTPEWGARQDVVPSQDPAQWGANSAQAQAYPPQQAYPAGPADPMTQQSAAIGQAQPGPSPWDVNVPAVPVTMPEAASQQAELAPRVGRYMGTPPTSSSFADRHSAPQAHEYEAATTMPAYQGSYQPAPNAQARPMATGGLTPGAAHQPAACCPPTGGAHRSAPVPSQYGPTSVARRDGYAPETNGGYRAVAPAAQPPADYREAYPNAAPNTPSGTYRNTYQNTYPAPNQQGAAGGPATIYPASTAGASHQYPQSGTARLTGVIDKPTVRTTYDSTRSSLY